MADTTYSIILEFDMKRFRSGMQNAQRQAKNLQNQFNRLAGVIGVAFGGRELVRFGAEAAQLNAEFQSAERAFQRFAAADTMDKLREATAGTVSELKLMQQANQAKNYRIPMEVLAEGLEFARIRARETGQSVDELVSKFTMGLGRESKLIIDDLGISQTELNEELDKGAEFAEAVLTVMRRQGAEAGKYIETSADKVDQLNASWQNFKATLGDSRFYENILDLLNELVKEAESLVDTVGRFGDWDGGNTAFSLVNPFMALVDYINGSSDAQADYNKRVDELNTRVLDQWQDTWTNTTNATDRAAAAVDLYNTFLQQSESLTSHAASLSGDAALETFALAEAYKKGAQQIAAQDQAVQDYLKSLEKVTEVQTEAQEFAQEDHAQNFGARGLMALPGSKGPGNIPAPNGAFTNSLNAYTQEMRALAEQSAKVQTIFSTFPMLQDAFGQAFDASLVSGEEFFKTMERLAMNLVRQLVVQLATMTALAGIASALTGGGSTFVGGFTSLFNQGGGLGGLLMRGGDLYNGVQQGGSRNARTN